MILDYILLFTLFLNNIFLDFFFLNVLCWSLVFSRISLYGFLDHSVFQVNGAVGDGSKPLIVGYDNEGLSELVTQIEEQLVQFCLVFGIEAS